MNTQRDIWECDDERTALWAADPGRAAMLAYLEVIAVWHEQVEAGIYWGVPALHRLPSTETSVLRAEPSTMRSRPSRYVRDDSAGHYVVPGQVRRLWQAAA